MPSDPKGLSLDQVIELVKSLDWLSFMRFVNSLVTGWRNAQPKQTVGHKNCDPECVKAHAQAIQCLAGCLVDHCNCGE